jgi:hypothetical protein
METQGASLTLPSPVRRVGVVVLVVVITAVPRALLRSCSLLA